MLCSRKILKTLLVVPFKRTLSIKSLITVKIYTIKKVLKIDSFYPKQTNLSLDIWFILFMF